MEFTKNYSDDLLLGGQSDQQAGGNRAGGPDLADYELPPCSGSSSSGSEQAPTSKQSPIKQRKSSGTQASSSQTVGVTPPDLAAVKNLLVASYSKVSHIFHWKRPIETGVVFAIGLTLIIALTFFSIISVVAYSALGIILASSLLRAYKMGMNALNKSPDTPVDHIWNKMLSLNVSMSPEKLHALVDSSHANINSSLVYFKQVLLVQDKLATFKFGLFLYTLTYIGAWFNGMTLITISYLSLFSIPILYEQNKTKIDEYLNLVTGQASTAISMVTNKLSSVSFGSSSSGGSSASKKQN